MANNTDKLKPTTSQTTNSVQPILNQTRVEQQMLSNVKEGLLVTLDWQTKGNTFTRKLSSLRFAARTYQEQLERALALEEHDGYMDFVLESCPHLSENVARLRAEHDEIRGSMTETMTKLERLMPNDHVGLKDLRQCMLDLLGKCDDHNRRETKLMQDALLIDDGCGD